jgi:predicted nucleic acid-binding protein
MTWVVDASVAIKWVVPEVLSEEAERLRAGEDEMLASDLLLLEVANALWRKTGNREISAVEADRAFALLTESGIDLRQTGPLLPRAMQVARRLNHPVYDCVYLALAEREHATFIAADRRLLRRVSPALHIAVADLRTV